MMNMTQRILLLFSLLIALGGCVVPFTAVGPGPVTVSDMQVAPQSTWNQASAAQAAFARKESQVWTTDGLLLNRLILIPAVPEGEAIFSIASETIALPVFEADMLPNELEELTESSMVKLLGEGDSAVETENLRPLKFGEQRGVMFDFNARLTDGPDYRGVVGAFIQADKLYMIIYVGADPYYFEKGRDEAEAIIRSARVI
jgi:hypothetical protein